MKLDLKKLKIAMARKSISSKKLSELSGIAYPTIIPYINGKREPGTEAIGKICEALDVDPADIIE